MTHYNDYYYFHLLFLIPVAIIRNENKIKV